MSEYNSFAENITKLVRSSNNQIGLLEGIQESLLTSADTVPVSFVNEQGERSDFSIPSWVNLNVKVDSAVRAVNTLLEGEGTVVMGDGTARQVQLSTIASPPKRITGVESPTEFGIDPNWWFEDLMYPSCHVTLDLKDKIDDTADRVRVMRVILPAGDADALNAYASLLQSPLGYHELVNALNADGISYTEDDEMLDLPMNGVDREGTFTVEGTYWLDNSEWCRLDGMTYMKLSGNGTVKSTGELAVGDKLSIGNFLYRIIDIRNDRDVRLEPVVGYRLPVVGDELGYYTEPWQNKYINIRFGKDELNIIYLKGINEAFNTAAIHWSEPIMFSSEDLRFRPVDTSVNAGMGFPEYYARYVADFGQRMIADVRENKISMSEGVRPDAPTLSANDFSVVQVNTQVNSALDSAEIAAVSADVQTMKSTISSLKGSIASKQTSLQTLTGAEYSNLLQSIQDDTVQLRQLETNYRTSLDHLQALLIENDGVDVKPKYRVRGFFGIPAPKGTFRKQHIISFEIEYRYVREDNTGVDLKTYTYTGADGAPHTGVYSDWNIQQTRVLEKEWDEATGMYVWREDNASDGSEININQVDIPITKGEKVEFRVRSISEAGWPFNPLKSEWSGSVIIAFPSNLSTSSEVENLIEDVNSEKTVITVQNQLETAGFNAHISDSTANVDSQSGVYFKHKAENLSYEFTDPDSGKVSTVTVQEALDSIFKFIKNFLDYSDSTKNFDSLLQILEISKATDAEKEAQTAAIALAFKNLQDAINDMNDPVTENTGQTYSSAMDSLRTLSASLSAANIIEDKPAPDITGKWTVTAMPGFDVSGLKSVYFDNGFGTITYNDGSVDSFTWDAALRSDGTGIITISAPSQAGEPNTVILKVRTNDGSVMNAEYRDAAAGIVSEIKLTRI